MRPEYPRMAEEQLRSPQDVQLDADIHLDVEGQVTLASLTRLVESWKDFLGEVGRGVTGNPAKDAVRYVIKKASGGSFALRVRPQPARENVPAAMMPRIARTVISGIEELNQAAKRPSHFSDDALAKLRDLARLVGPETPSLTVSNGRRRPVALSSTMLAHVESVLSPEVRTIGTIEGELEGLIIHGRKRFLLYDRLTGRQVICYFGNAVSWEELRDVFGKRMAVTGEIRSRRSGERASIDVSSYYVFPPEHELPSAQDVRGLIRNAE